MTETERTTIDQKILAFPESRCAPDACAAAGLFRNNDARQLIHTTRGPIRNEKDPDGTDRFYTRLYRAWRTYAEEYARNLERHIGRHLALLYSGFQGE